jgi:hypothetical protein
LRRVTAAAVQITADVVASRHQADNKKDKEADDPEASSSEAAAAAGRASPVFDIAA